MSGLALWALKSDTLVFKSCVIFGKLINLCALVSSLENAEKQLYFSHRLLKKKRRCYESISTVSGIVLTKHLLFLIELLKYF